MKTSIIFLFLLTIHSHSQEDTLKRKEYLDQIKQWVRPPLQNINSINCIDINWYNWLERTHELPPDFSKMPSNPLLPNPLEITYNNNIQTITSIEQWKKHSVWIKDQYQFWISGTIPPAPKQINAKIIASKKENQVLIETVLIQWGPLNKAQVTIELMIPPYGKKLPVFLTQWNHKAWAQIAVRRGYIGCIYSACDENDDTKNYCELYPNYDFAKLMQRAWAAQRVVDYLQLRSEVDTNKIAITGHSRNGKQSLMAAAFDKRIDAVIESSSGTGGDNAFRFTDKRYDSETIEKITYVFPDWFHPRLRFFVGREDKLPIDQNQLMALIAPRALLFSTAINESQGDAWAIQKVYESVKSVYRFMNAENNIAIINRQGEHSVAARDIENNIDFLDQYFKLKSFTIENTCFYNYSFEEWKKNHPSNLHFNKLSDSIPKNKIELRKKKESILQNITKLIGEEPYGLNPTIKINYNSTQNSSDDFISFTTGRPDLKKEKIGNLIIRPYNSMGDNLFAQVYYPEKEGKPNTEKGKLPLVIYLHEYDYATGYSGLNCIPFIKKMTSQGIAVLAYDQIGFGTRIEEYNLFYKRYPNWSFLGKMMTDAKSAIQLASQLKFIDSASIFLSGYALGGTVALYTATDCEKLKGVISVAGFTPYKTNSTEIAGIKEFYQLNGLIPYLGYFQNNINDIPYDYKDIFTCIAPKPILIINPQFNRHAEKDKINETINYTKKVYEVYNLTEHIKFEEPLTFDNYSLEMMDTIAKWILENK